MFEDIYTYIERSKEERQAHLILTEDCIEIGGSSGEFRGLLAFFLKTTIPTGAFQKISLCHACNNSKCANPKHLYWGTAAENVKDAVDSGRWHKTRHTKNIAQKYRVAILESNPQSKGWIARASEKMKVSKVQIRRVVHKHLPEFEAYLK